MLQSLQCMCCPCVRAGASGKGPSLDVPEVHDDAGFDTHCASKGAGVCLIGLLDGSKAKR
jgi:hypothetical protein